MANLDDGFQNCPAKLRIGEYKRFPEHEISRIRCEHWRWRNTPSLTLANMVVTPTRIARLVRTVTGNRDEPNHAE
jgi:hypothetical protein